MSIFSVENDLYEVYFNFGVMFGIIYADEYRAYDIKDEIKELFEEEYKKNKQPSDEFIEMFGEKYEVSLPPDLFFNEQDLFGF